MSEPIHNDGSDLAKKRLAKASRTKDISVRLAWAISIGEAMLLGLVAMTLMDYWLMLPIWMRSTGGGVISLMAAIGIFRLVRFFRRRTSIKEAALDMEAAKPELGCQISTAAEYLSGERQATHEYEPELVAALETKAAAELRTATVGYSSRWRRPAVILGLTVAAVLALLVVMPGLLTALRRTALPLSNATYTQVHVEPGNAEIPAGSDLEITNVFTGRAPTDARIHWQRDGDTEWQEAPMITRSSEGAYLYALLDVRQPVKYRVTGGDAVSGTFEIQPYVPPEVKELTVRIEYPRYTRVAPVTQTSPDISALRASVVEIQIEPSVKLSKAKLRFSAAPEELPLQPVPGGLWSAQLTVSKDTDYWIELFDEKGRPGAEGTPHHIRAISDTPPTVEIEAPGQDMRASATNSVPLTFSIKDDFGVEQVEIVFHKLGSAEQVVPVTVEKDSQGNLTATSQLDLAKLDLKDFEVVAYHSQARDNNSLDGPGVGKSPVYFVEITQLKGGEPKPQVPANKANLLAIQKQLIADTASLAPDAPDQSFGELAARQTDAAQLGKLYHDALAGTGAPAKAIREMQSALESMNSAATNLSGHKQRDALPPAENALAHLYQVLKQLPELEDLPTQPKPPAQPVPNDKLAVVLEAIQQKKEQQTVPTPVEEALEQAEKLARAQSALNAALREAQQASSEAQEGIQSDVQGEESQGQGEGQAHVQAQAEGQGTGIGKGSGKGEGEGEGQGTAQGKGKGKGERQGKGQNSDQADQEIAKPNPGKGQGSSKDAQLAKLQQGAKKPQPSAKKPSHGKGKGQGKATGKGQGQGQGQPEGQREAKPSQEPSSDQEQPESSDEMAAKEQQLGEQAAELAETLQRLSGKDTRLGRNAGQNAKLAGQKLAEASAEIRKGRFGAAGVHGFEGELALRDVVAHLERITGGQPDLADVASEDAPKEYERLISDYFKKLSHAE